MKQSSDKDQRLTTADIARGDSMSEDALDRATLRDTIVPQRQPSDIAPDDSMSGGPRMDRPAPPDAVMAERQPSAQLFLAGEAQDLRSRWDSIQTRFVDEPRQSVQEADALVAATINRLADIFVQERSKLESQWDRGDKVSTEDLRLSLQRYRSFFTRLLSV
jgi:hypothetical protein